MPAGATLLLKVALERESSEKTAQEQTGTKETVSVIKANEEGSTAGSGKKQETGAEGSKVKS